MSDALANAGSDVTVAQTSFGAQAFTGSGTPGTGGTTIAAYAWTLVGKPPGSSASLSGASTATVTLTPDLVGNYRLFLVVTDDVGNVSASNPYEAPDAAFTQYRVQLTNTELQKLAPGERNYTNRDHEVISYLEGTVAPLIEPATTAAFGVVKLDETPVDSANPKAVTQDRVVISMQIAGLIAQTAAAGAGNPSDALAYAMIPEDGWTLFAYSLAFGDSGTMARADYVFDVYKQAEADWVNNTFGASLKTVTITAPGADNVPRASYGTLGTPTLFSARDVVSVVVTGAPASSGDQGSDLSIQFHFKRKV